jgi:hypothetical protein
LISKAQFEDAAERLSKLYVRHRTESLRQLKNTTDFILAKGPIGLVPLARVIIGASRPDADMLAPNASGRLTDQQRSALASAGYRRVVEGDAEFETHWTAYTGLLKSLGVDGPSKGTPTARAVRSFQVPAQGTLGDRAAPPMETDAADIHDAIARFQSGERPAQMGTPHGWHVRDPLTGQPLPLKAIWALATGVANADFKNSGALRARLERLGFACVDLRDLPDALPVYDSLYPDDLPATHTEGAPLAVTVNRYERNPAARQACLLHYRQLRKATLCEACDFDFEARYGELGAGFIHVHHVVKLADIGAAYQVDPLRDLVPLCPNCHAMIHRLPTEANAVADLKRRIRG